MFTVREIAFIIGGKAKNVDLDLMVKDFSIDSRLIKPDSAFFCIKGEKFDGADFAEEAISKGSVVAIAPFSSKIAPHLPVILVDDTVLAMARLAKEKLKRMKAKVIGVTGSVGKTTTKELIYTILSTHYKVFKSRKSFNNHIGLPLTILEAPFHTDYLILEYGMNHPGEIRYLTSIARPNYPIITKIGTAHIEFFGTKENIALEKGTLFKEMDYSGHAFLNASTDCFDILKSMIPYTAGKTPFGLDAGDVKPEKYRLEEFSSSFSYKGKEFYFPLPGRGMLENVMGAIAIGEHLGIPLEDMQEVLKDFKGEKMRMEKKVLKDITIINDAYNSNPDSLTELLRTFKENGKRLIFVLGDMLELGERAEEEHRKIGKIFKELGHKILVTVGELSKFISEEAKKEGITEVYHFNGKEEVVSFLRNYLKPGDWLILKASRGLALEEIVNKLEEIL
jgi:UDP-N-acetylmuramoyl-tripeptide--D-alanyl-D-alanine ligase